MRINQDAFNLSNMYGVCWSVPDSELVEGGETAVLKPEVGASCCVGRGRGLRDTVCVTKC